jgi:aminotransferase
MIATLLAVVDPGDDVIVFEPLYEILVPDAVLVGASTRAVTLQEPSWSFDSAELAAAFNNRTRAIVINTPNNPTGKVFTRAELQEIAALFQKWDVIAIMDEIYEHILYRCRARDDGVDRRDAGSHGDDQQLVEDVQRDRMARGLDDCAG